MGSLVLVIDDDPELGALVQEALKPIGLAVCQAFTGFDGLRKFYKLHPDLIVLDISMPDINGFDVCLRIQEMTNIPILMLTAHTNESDILRGFSVGVDDFVKKPFVLKEFQARVKALLRRTNNNNNNVNEVTPITQYKDDRLNINLETRSVELNGNMIKLSSIEYGLLTCLTRNMGKVVSHSQLMQEIWGSSYGNKASTLTIYIYYLRKKLEDSQHGYQYIHTQWGRGYMFLPQAK